MSEKEENKQAETPAIETQQARMQEDVPKKKKKKKKKVKGESAPAMQADAPVAAPHSVTATQPRRFMPSWNTSWKVMLAVALILFGITFGIGSGVLRPAPARGAADETTVDEQALTGAIAEADVREMFQKEVDRQIEKALGEGGQYDDLLKRIRNAVAVSEESIKTANAAYAKGMADIERARKATIENGAGSVEQVQKQVRDTLKAIGIDIPKQDISCLTDPSWSPDEAAKKLAEERNAARAKEASDPAAARAVSPSSPSAAIDPESMVRAALEKTAASLGSNPETLDKLTGALEKFNASSKQTQPASSANAASSPSKGS